MAGRKSSKSREPVEATTIDAKSVEQRMDDLACNHCQRKMAGLKELRAHKREHNYYKDSEPDQTFSITSSAQSWND
jgi:hypothetical protein